jgi:predicted DNA-binding transcriptional regulator YafY
MNKRYATQACRSYVPEAPYFCEWEFLGDLLRFGADVKVMAPPELRSRIKTALHEAVGRYV